MNESPAPEFREPSRDELEEVNNSPIRQSWYEDDGPTVILELPHRCKFSGVVLEDERGPYMLASYLSVPRRLIGNKIGERLTRALTVTAVEQGITTMRSVVESHYALSAWRRVFGDERLTFYHDMPAQHEGSLPMTAEQAVASLQQAYAPEKGAQPGDVSVDVEVDLTGLDVSGWEGPLPIP